MSFSDHPPTPSPFVQPPFTGVSEGCFWPQLPMNNEYPDTNSHYEQTPRFKRPKNSESNPPNNAPFPPMNRMNPTNLPVNKGTSHIFFKTRMCAKYREGTCPNGENCTFAHGFEDLREPPPNWQELVRERDRGSGNWNDDQRIIHKMKICRKFYNGEECPYGEKCNFLHKSPSGFKADMVEPRESSAINVGTMIPMMGQSDQTEINKQVNADSDAFRFNNMKPVYWKTKICSKWEITGHCPFGERCHFAHGQSDLQAPGGRVEPELLTNACFNPAKPPSVPANEASPTNNLVGAPTIEGGEGKKCLSKLKGTKKINRIYADWIEDLTPPHGLTSIVEN